MTRVEIYNANYTKEQILSEFGLMDAMELSMDAMEYVGAINLVIDEDIWYKTGFTLEKLNSDRNSAMEFISNVTSLVVESTNKKTEMLSKFDFSEN